MKPLETLPIRLRIPRTVAQHPFVFEARALTHTLRKTKGLENGGVIGTADKQRAELYGWCNPVTTHIDSHAGDSWMYASVIRRGGLREVGTINPDCGLIHFANAYVGEVFRLNDRLPHWTQGTGDTIAIFVGGFDTPNDAKAFEILQRGINRLAAGAWTAPRVREGFRVRLDEEVLATKDFTAIHHVRAGQARRHGWTVLECIACGAPADRPDHAWPYFADHYCRGCLLTHEVAA